MFEELFFVSLWAREQFNLTFASRKETIRQPAKGTIGLERRKQLIDCLRLVNSQLYPLFFFHMEQGHDKWRRIKGYYTVSILPQGMNGVHVSKVSVKTADLLLQ